MLGTPFYLMEHVKGRIFADPSLPGVEPADRARIYEVRKLAFLVTLPSLQLWHANCARNLGTDLGGEVRDLRLPHFAILAGNGLPENCCCSIW